ncbi:hypothetical protein OHA61_09275 [Streptomyces sp. NBC_00885]|uniref:hypothetical protein n=1 Tax=Streptomyces sp. NBC_00885 TaxID=2975857 RepID=UPI00386D60B0|nr:hypothetical protein OHA61_09275 [Streptomyces sp. NBC_00885]
MTAVTGSPVPPLTVVAESYDPVPPKSREPFAVRINRLGPRVVEEPPEAPSWACQAGG